MSICVFSTYGKKTLGTFSIDAYFLYTYTPMYDKILFAYSEIAHVKKTALKSSYSLCKLKYFWVILHVQLNTFGVYSVYIYLTTFRAFSEFAARFQNTQKEILHKTLPDYFKGTVF
jgi:hypothetical protein